MLGKCEAVSQKYRYVLPEKPATCPLLDTINKWPAQGFQNKSFGQFSFNKWFFWFGRMLRVLKMTA